MMIYIFFFFLLLYHFIVASLSNIHKQLDKVKDLAENWKNKIFHWECLFECEEKS